MHPSPALDVARASSNRAVASLVLIFILLLAGLAIYRQEPMAEGANTPATEFSARQAMQYVSEVAQQPHPMGTAAHEEVRAYILRQLGQMGVTAESHDAAAVNAQAGYPFYAGTVRNIIARLKGTDNTKAVLLVGHYDSTPSGPGAADDASAVGILLETLSALKAGPPLRNDVIFLLTDGEEMGLLGAKAFTDEQDWSKDVGVALNFEARGASGPSVMFETSAGNDWLIREFSKAAPHPVANSLMGEIYKLLPNNTDLTVFKQAGLPGLNFAFIRGAVYYHSMQDDLQRIDQRSLQHQGSYALALARHFGNLPLNAAVGGDAVYSDAGFFFIHYPKAWVMPLTILLAALFIGLIVLGIKKRRLTVRGIIRGFFGFLLALVVTPLAVTLLWSIIKLVHGQYKLSLSGDIYNSKFYIIAFTLFGAAVFLSLYNWLSRKVSVFDLAIGAMCWWGILAAVSSLLLPGGSYLFVWPLLSSLIAMGVIWTVPERSTGSLRAVIVLGLFAIPVIILFAPLIYLLFVALTVNLSGVAVIFLSLSLGLLVPLFVLLNTGRRWWLPGGLALASVAFLVVGSLTAGINRDHPKPDTVFYCFNADEGKGVWASVDDAADGWSSQFFSAGAEKAALNDYLYKPSSRMFLQSKADTLPQLPPSVEMISDQSKDSIRTVNLRITSQRHAPLICVYLNPEVKIRSTLINGKRVDDSSVGIIAKSGNAWGIRYYAPPAEGVDLTLEIENSAPLKMRVVDQSYELPQLPGSRFKKRPDTLTASTYPASDSTLVVKSFSF